MLNFKGDLLAFLICIVISSSNSLSNEEVITYIDISSQTVKVVYKISVVNKLLDPVNSYDFVVDPLMKSNLSYIEASDEKGNSMHVNRMTSDDLVKFNILFIKPISPGEVQKFKVLLVFIDCLRSYPERVKQNEKHFVLFTFNVYYFSSYLTEIQSLNIYPGNTKVTVVDGAKYKMSNDSKYFLHYGPYFKKEPESEYFSVIHYENISPFLIAEKIERIIQLSHWGYVTVINRVFLIHNGPKFVGPFKRQANQIMGKQNVGPDTKIETFTTYFPEYAFDIYVKDDIGLISSFQVDYKLQRVEVLMKPRFVLYGGWKTEYEIGYSLPIKYYVSYVNNLFTLFFPLLDKLFADMVMKDVKLDIILPEGAVFQDISPHYELENNTNKYCYIVDFICREVVSFKMNNLVDNHSKQNISLIYSFSQIYLLMKPIFVAVFLYVLFLLFLMYVHLTSKSTKENAQSNAQGLFQKNKKTFAQEIFICQNLVSQLPLKQQVKTKKNQSKAKVKSKKR